MKKSLYYYHYDYERDPVSLVSVVLREELLLPVLDY